MVKETGAGISRGVAMRLKGTGVRALDISGAGGTSFSKIELLRSREMNDSRREAIGTTFAEWGIPAPISVLHARDCLPVIASGGILDGLQAAKSIALGACCAGAAKAVLADSLVSAEAVKVRLNRIIDELKVAMMLTGSADVRSLRKKECILTGPLRAWAGRIQGDSSWTF